MLTICSYVCMQLLYRLPPVPDKLSERTGMLVSDSLLKF